MAPASPRSSDRAAQQGDLGYHALLAEVVIALNCFRNHCDVIVSPCPPDAPGVTYRADISTLPDWEFTWRSGSNR